MDTTRWTIGMLSEFSECSVPTIRYYEQIGLMSAAHRASNGHRYYGQSDINRLLFIKRCRDFGFPIEQIRILIELVEDTDRSCGDVREIALKHLDAVHAKLNELKQLESGLKRFVAQCSDKCAEGSTRDCAAILDLKAKDPRDGGNSCCGP